MHGEEDFLRKLLENPADDTVRLVFADWLDERADDESRTKAKFLRLTVRLLEPNRPARWHNARRKEMRPLAAKLSTDWLAVVSRLKVEGCGAQRAEDRKRQKTRLLFDFVCEKRWDEMKVTEAQEVRFCEGCKENVHYCGTIMEARAHAQRGHCVAVDSGIVRREHDLSQPLMVLGRLSPAAQREQEERLRVDAVSQEREERKRNQNAGSEP